MFLSFLIVVLFGVGLGLQAAIQPGPLMAVVIGESLRGGRRHGLRFALIPLWTDPPMIVLALLIVSHVPPSVLGVISLLGAALMIHLARLGLKWDEHDLFYSALRPSGADAGAGQTARWTTAVGMNFLNPSLSIYAFTVHSPLILGFGLISSLGYVTAFLLTVLAVNASIAFVTGTFRRRLSGRLLRGINRVLSYFLFAMAILFIIKGIYYFIPR